jgi:hypothetical protein
MDFFSFDFVSWVSEEGRQRTKIPVGYRNAAGYVFTLVSLLLL